MLSNQRELSPELEHGGHESASAAALLLQVEEALALRAAAAPQASKIPHPRCAFASLLSCEAAERIGVRQSGRTGGRTVIEWLLLHDPAGAPSRVRRENSWSIIRGAWG
jgi:hypothetical protein